MNKMVSTENNIGTGRLLYSKISDEICRYISEHKLKIGDKLPSERNLAEILGVSRNSIREAIRSLENQGIVQVESGRGSFIQGEVTDHSMLIKLKKQNFFELFEIKTVLEEHIIKKLVSTISETTLNTLEDIAEQMISLCERGIFPQELDDIFHSTLIEAYGNKEMTNVVNGLMKGFNEYNNTYFNRGIGIVNNQNQSIFDTIPLHLDIVKYMKQKDSKKAVKAYREIIKIDVNIYSLIKE